MAIAWVRKNIPGPLIFLLVTDDLEWCREFLIDEKVKDIVIASKSIHHDLALLTTSAHNILDYGSYGHWGAFMSDGHTLSIDIENKKFHKEMTAITDKWHVYDIKDFQKEEQTQPATTPINALSKKEIVQHTTTPATTTTTKTTTKGLLKKELVQPATTTTTTKRL
jgi:Glycosyl transferase family 11